MLVALTAIRRITAMPAIVSMLCSASAGVTIYFLYLYIRKDDLFINLVVNLLKSKIYAKGKKFFN